ncbi:hypothetical protein IAD21_04074 [Abditibacteriota bacterium]|nr:hypothetical protein IAD21_04074 [Abditibacteriota bacterium]
MGRFVSRQNKFAEEALISLALLFVFQMIAWHNYNSIRGVVFISPSAYGTTDGIITHSYVYSSGGKSASYDFNITYTYSVAGRSYSSDQITFGYRGSSDRNFADSYVRKYPTGSQVVVHYKADEPTFAVLEPTVMGNTRVVFWVVLIGSIVSLLGLGRTIWRLRQMGVR